MFDVQAFDILKIDKIKFESPFKGGKLLSKMDNGKSNKRADKKIAAKKNRAYSGKYSSKHVRIVEEQKSKDKKITRGCNSCRDKVSNK